MAFPLIWRQYVSTLYVKIYWMLLCAKYYAFITLCCVLIAHWIITTLKLKLLYLERGITYFQHPGDARRCHGDVRNEKFSIAQLFSGQSFSACSIIISSESRDKTKTKLIHPTSATTLTVFNKSVCISNFLKRGPEYRECLKLNLMFGIT